MGGGQIYKHRDQAWKYWKGRGKGIRCAHDCVHCEERGRAAAPDDARCVSCGHTYAVAEVLRGGNAMMCAGCDALEWRCGHCRLPRRRGSGPDSERWFCWLCWAEKLGSEQVPWLVSAYASAELDGSLAVTCCNLAGEELLAMEAEPGPAGRQRVEARLREAVQRLAPDERVAADCWPYTQAEFEAHYPERDWARKWHEAPPVAARARLVLCWPEEDSSAVPERGLAPLREVRR